MNETNFERLVLDSRFNAGYTTINLKITYGSTMKFFSRFYYAFGFYFGSRSPAAIGDA
jgi:hypothetical protein